MQANFEQELSCALEKETRGRVALEVSAHQAFQAMQADFEQEVNSRAGNDLKHSLDIHLTFFKEQLEELAKVLETVKREHQDRMQDMDHMRSSLMELRTDILCSLPERRET